MYILERGVPVDTNGNLVIEPTMFGPFKTKQDALSYAMMGDSMQHFIVHEVLKPVDPVEMEG